MIFQAITTRPLGKVDAGSTVLVQVTTGMEKHRDVWWHYHVLHFIDLETQDKDVMSTKPVESSIAALEILERVIQRTFAQVVNQNDRYTLEDLRQMFSHLN